MGIVFALLLIMTPTLIKCDFKKKVDETLSNAFKKENTLLMDESRFEKEVLGGTAKLDDVSNLNKVPGNKNNLWLLYFSAPWCRHCKRF